MDTDESGYKGSCYACEPVGELNVRLAAEIAELKYANTEYCKFQKMQTREIAELEEKRSTWQELAEMRGDKIAELEKAHANVMHKMLEEITELKELNDKLTDYDKRLAADAIREMVMEFMKGHPDSLSVMYHSLMEYADNLEKE